MRDRSTSSAESRGSVGLQYRGLQVESHSRSDAHGKSISHVGIHFVPLARRLLHLRRWQRCQNCPTYEGESAIEVEVIGPLYLRERRYVSMPLP